jgi:hypothetical protein
MIYAGVVLCKLMNNVLGKAKENPPIKLLVS